MKVLKFGLTLILGLSMGWGAQALAQSASSQTQEVVPQNGTSLPEVPANQTQAAGEEIAPAPTSPQRGIPNSKKIEAMFANRQFDQIEAETDKYLNKAKGTECDKLLFRMGIQERLMVENYQNGAQHQAQAQAYQAQLEAQCPDMAEVYFFKAFAPGLTPQEMLMYLNQAIEKDPTYGAPYVLRGDARWSLEPEAACADYKKAAELQDGMAVLRLKERCTAKENAGAQN